MTPHAHPFRIVACLILFVSAIAYSTPATAQRTKGEPGAAESKQGKGDSSSGIKKYDDVITKDAKTFAGVLLVHQVDDKVYFEIPQDALDQLMLWNIEVAKGPAGMSFGGRAIGSRVVRFSRRGDKVYLWNVGFEKRGSGDAIAKSIAFSTMDSIMAGFSVAAEGKDRSTVIRVDSLFLKDQSDFSVKRAVSGATAVDASRSYVEQIKAFPTNIEVRSLLTFRTGSGGGSHSALLHHSLVQLPEQPMMGRYFDPRVGYFTEAFQDYSGKNYWMESRRFITRYRLEKKDPEADVSEPVKPIVFYLAREVPPKWRPYLKKGVEDWQKAFEGAGYKNAIVCKDAPTVRQDPQWDAEDARYSVIRWVAEPTQNAMGPHVHDPRSGEIVSAHIIFWHDITKLVQQWYFVQCGATDSRVKRLPLSDQVIGECLRYVACHEVGHTLGLRHNHRASQAYSIAQLRDPKFTSQNGSVASIMSYGRFNYVAQPGDKVTRFTPVVGPYDMFAIHWGYAPIADAKKPSDEQATLDQWAARQMKEPLLRFGGEDGPSRVDPTVLTENIGSDRVDAARLGLSNLKRVTKKLVPATTAKGKDFELLEDTYKSVLRHRTLWLSAVMKQIGGVVESRTLGGRGKQSFARVSKKEQARALKFLLEHALQPPAELLDAAVLNRFRYQGAADDVMSQQERILSGLLSRQRFSRLFDAAVLEPETAYSAAEYLSDLQAGVWSELKADEPKIGPLRRALQRNYLNQLSSAMDPPPAAPPSTGRGRRSTPPSSNESDLRALALASLTNLSKQITEALAKDCDALTRAHLQDCQRQIEQTLDPKD